MEYINIAEILSKAIKDIDIHVINSEKLLLAAVYQNKPGIVELLLKKGANVDIQIEKGDPRGGGLSALMIAAYLNRYEIVPLLLKAGANPKLEDEKGKTALDIAEKYQNDTLFLIKCCTYLSQRSKIKIALEP